MEPNEVPIPTGPPRVNAVAPVGPPLPQTETPDPGAQPPQDLARLRFILGSVMGLATLGAVLLYFGLVKYFDDEPTPSMGQTPVAVATEFLEAERVGNFEVMNGLASDSEKCFGSGSLERMRSIVNKIDFRSYNLELPGNATAEAEAQTDAGAVVSGVVDIGYVTTIEFTMVAESDQWRVCGFSIE